MSDFPSRHARSLRSAPDRQPPDNWAAIRSSIRFRWLTPLIFIDWLMEWAVYALSCVSFLELLEYCGSFSILIAVIFYFVDAPQRTKLRHYQAWQVINTAQGKGGSGGRIDALRELNDDGVPLVGVDLADAFLQDVRLTRADLRRSNFGSADLQRADFTNAEMEQSDLISANLRDATLVGVDAAESVFTDADLNGADLRTANLHRAAFDRADLRDTDLGGIKDWQTITLRLANIHGVHNAPSGFIEWARQNGAVDVADDYAWYTLLQAPGPRVTRSNTKR